MYKMMEFCLLNFNLQARTPHGDGFNELWRYPSFFTYYQLGRKLPAISEVCHTSIVSRPFREKHAVQSVLIRPCTFSFRATEGEIHTANFHQSCYNFSREYFETSSKHGPFRPVTNMSTTRNYERVPPRQKKTFFNHHRKLSSYHRYLEHAQN